MNTHHSTLVSYLKAGLLLHLATLIEITAIICIYLVHPINQFPEKKADATVMLLVPALLCSSVLAQLDARSRYQNYKLIKDLLYLHGFEPRLIRPFMYSRCQRDAVLTAATELGMGTSCSNYFKGQNYRWFHLLPDFIFASPKILFTPAFIKSTFFAPYYRNRIDFNNHIATRDKFPLTRVKSEKILTLNKYGT